jgi:hypothetical protein
VPPCPNYAEESSWVVRTQSIDKPDEKTGALNTTPPEKLPLGNFPDGVYHRYDYAFWYRNLEANVATRVKAYLARQQASRK